MLSWCCFELGAIASSKSQIRIREREREDYESWKIGMVILGQPINILRRVWQKLCIENSEIKHARIGEQGFSSCLS